MKLELIVTFMLTNLSVGDREKRSTVLTDESKRILEHFDSSNFDKREALNYIDIQKYDNQIRGKRSKPEVKSNFKRIESFLVNGDTQRQYDYESSSEPEAHENFTSPFGKLTNMYQSTGWNLDRSGKCLMSSKGQIKPIYARKRRGHRHKKKQKLKQYQTQSEDTEEYDEDEAELERYRKRMQKKKKRHYWSNWSKWSPCSVTCGRGRQIRWRKCIVRNCTNGELEMGEKTCQLPACSLLTKLLGL